MEHKARIRTTNGRGRLYDSILDTVGDTPAVRVNNVGVAGRTIYVKAESFNPGGSVKDRLALNIIEEAERNGSLSGAPPDHSHFSGQIGARSRRQAADKRLGHRGSVTTRSSR